MSKLLPRFNTVSKYLIAAVLIIVPLFPKFPLIKVPGTYVAVRFEDLLLSILAVLTLVKILPNFKSFFKDTIVQAFLIFFDEVIESVVFWKPCQCLFYITHGCWDEFQKIRILFYMIDKNKPPGVFEFALHRLQIKSPP